MHLQLTSEESERLAVATESIGTGCVMMIETLLSLDGTPVTRETFEQLFARVHRLATELRSAERVMLELYRLLSSYPANNPKSSTLPAQSNSTSFPGVWLRSFPDSEDALSEEEVPF